MNVLLKILSFAIVTQRTAAAIAATVVITAGVIEYLQNNRRNK
jgi:hypothetical protein